MGASECSQAPSKVVVQLQTTNFADPLCCSPHCEKVVRFGSLTGTAETMTGLVTKAEGGGCGEHANGARSTLPPPPEDQVEIPAPERSEVEGMVEERAQEVEDSADALGPSVPLVPVISLAAEDQEDQSSLKSRLNQQQPSELSTEEDRSGGDGLPEAELDPTVSKKVSSASLGEGEAELDPTVSKKVSSASLGEGEAYTVDHPTGIEDHGKRYTAGPLRIISFGKVSSFVQKALVGLACTYISERTGRRENAEFYIDAHMQHFTVKQATSKSTATGAANASPVERADIVSNIPLGRVQFVVPLAEEHESAFPAKILVRLPLGDRERQQALMVAHSEVANQQDKLSLILESQALRDEFVECLSMLVMSSAAGAIHGTGVHT